MINKDNENQIMAIAREILPKWFVERHKDDILSEGYIAIWKAKQKHDEKIAKLNTYSYQHIIWRLRLYFKRQYKHIELVNFERELRRDSNNIKNTEDIYLDIYSSYNNIYNKIYKITNKTKRDILLEYIRTIDSNISKTKRVRYIVNKLNISKTTVYNTLEELKELVAS